MGDKRNGRQQVRPGDSTKDSGQFFEFKKNIKQLINQGNLMAATESCVSALQQDFEISSVQILIKKNNLPPPVNPFTIKHWPWTMKIYTLGRFSMLLDNVPLQVAGKAQAKPVELLKALIAMGGRDVSEHRINAALWPDLDGDHAHSAFTTTLSRCRKLVGKKLLSFHHGKLNLNDQLCWVDSWVFERSMGELGLMLEQQDQPLKQVIQQKVDYLFGLYHGQFLEKELQVGWMLPLQERLSSKFQRLLKQLIHYYSQSAGNCKKVISLYEKARELNPMSEENCRGLMRCHAAQGNCPEALAIFERCHVLFMEAFGIKPSEKTTRLYQLIKGGGQEQLLHSCKLCNQVT